MIARYADLTGEVLRKLPATAAAPEILAALRWAGARFCEIAECWREDLPAFDAVAGRRAYALPNNRRADIKRILRVGYRSAAELAANPDAAGMEIGPAHYRYDRQTRELVFAEGMSFASGTRAFLVTALLVPWLDADEIAEGLLARYAAALVCGAAMELCSQPGRPALYNPQLALAYRLEFNNAAHQAFRDAQTEFTARPLVAQKPYGLL